MAPKYHILVSMFLLATSACIEGPSFEVVAPDGGTLPDGGTGDFTIVPANPVVGVDFSMKLRADSSSAAESDMGMAEWTLESGDEFLEVQPDGTIRGKSPGRATVRATMPSGAQIVEVVVTEGYRSVTVGGQHTCAVQRNEELVCWGLNNYGQLGDGTRVSSTVPLHVFGETLFTRLCGGELHTCGLSSDRDVLCWGNQERGQAEGLNVPVSEGLSQRTSDVSCGLFHNCAITAMNEVFCWGANDSRQSAPGSDESNIGSPTPVALPAKIVAVAPGGFHTCALTDQGKALCWGQNTFAQCGVSVDQDPVTQPVEVPGFTFTALAAGRTHTCGITTEGKTVCWGKNDAGQLGDPSFDDLSSASPIEVPLDEPLERLSTSHGDFQCGVTQSGEAYCWGDNSLSQLGSGDLGAVEGPVAVASDMPFESISGGDAHVCGLTTGGIIFCWGNNEESQLGDRTTMTAEVPVRFEAVLARTFGVDPRGTFLRVDETDVEARGPTKIDLAASGFEPGDVVRMQRFGGYENAAIDPALLIAVFTETDVLKPPVQHPRLETPIDAGADYMTPATAGTLPTDIAEDFRITDQQMTIPDEAAFLFIGTADTVYGDNAGWMNLRMTVESPAQK